MPLDVGGLGQETGWLSRWAFQVGAIARDSIGRQAVEARALTATMMEQPTAEGILGVGFRVVRASYSFAVDGGAQGTIALLGATSIPANAVIVGGWVNVTTLLTGGLNATAALQVQAANDIVNQAAVAGAPWSSTGRKSVIPAFTGATSVLTSVARDVSLVIGTADLTAGAFDVILFYVLVA